MIEIKNFEHEKLTIKQWLVADNETWCVLGKNGSGKQFLDQLLTGELTAFNVEQLTLPKANKVGVVSFEAQQAIYENEIKIDSTDFNDSFDLGTLAKEFLPTDKLTDPLIAEFGLVHKLDSGYRQLSTGEGRKLLILQSIFSGVDLLVCDNPFDSLDIGSCEALSKALSLLKEKNISVLLILNNRQDIPEWCQQVAFIERGQLEVIGELDNDETIRQLDALLTPPLEALEWPQTINQLTDYKHPYIVKLTNGKVHVSVAKNGNSPLAGLSDLTLHKWWFSKIYLLSNYACFSAVGQDAQPSKSVIRSSHFYGNVYLTHSDSGFSWILMILLDLKSLSHQGCFLTKLARRP